jgi:hypothetical protein
MGPGTWLNTAMQPILVGQGFTPFKMPASGTKTSPVNGSTVIECALAPIPTPPGDIIDALAALASRVAVVAGNGQIAIVAAPAQAVAINLRLGRQPPYIVLASTTLTPGTIIAVALNALVSAVEGPPEIDSSSDAIIHEESGPSVNIGGGVMAHPLRSFFQSDSVGLRLRWPVTWGLRSPNAIAWMEV